MAVDIAFKASVDLGGGEKSLSSLKKEFKETQKQLEGLTVGSEKYVDTLKKLGKVKDDIGDLNTTIRAFNPEGKIAALSSTIGGVASGFQAATAATALFGSENKDLEKTLLKVQASMAFADGIKGIVGLGDAFKNLRLILLSNPLMLIGAVIAGIGVALFALKDKVAVVGKAFDFLSDGLKSLIKNAQTFLNYAGIIDSEGDAMIKKAQDNARKRGEFEKQVREKTKEILAQRAKDQEEHDKKAQEAYKVHLAKLAEEKKKAHDQEEKDLIDRVTKFNDAEAKRVAGLRSAAADEAAIEAELNAMFDAEELRKKNKKEEGLAQDKQIDADRAAMQIQSITAVASLTDSVFALRMNNAKKGSAEEQRLARQAFDIGKALQLSLATITGIQSVQNSFATAALSPVTILNPAYPFISASIAGVLAAANIAKIAATKFGGGGGSVASVSAPSTGSTPTLNAPSQSTTQLAPDGSIVNPTEQNQPAIKAYVVETEMTDTQKRVAQIEKTATN